LFGTNNENSDEDYMGVFMSSFDDLFGIGKIPDEWDMSVKKSDGPRNSLGDVDRKLFSLKRFFKLAAQGQPAALETFFVPKDKIISTSPDWEHILANKELFFSKEAILPFVGFARSQANRAVLKGEHLNLLNHLIRALADVAGKDTISSYFRGAVLAKTEGIKEEGQVELFGKKLRLFKNEHGFLQLDIAGHFYDPGSKIKMLRLSLASFVERYGDRSKTAAANGYDFDSVLHCFRMIFEATEFLATGKISLPRPPDEVEFLMKIKRKEYPTPDVDLFSAIDSKVRYLETEGVANSQLPLKADWVAISKLCVEMHVRAFGCRS